MQIMTDAYLLNCLKKFLLVGVACLDRLIESLQNTSLLQKTS